MSESEEDVVVEGPEVVDQLTAVVGGQLFEYFSRLGIDTYHIPDEVIENRARQLVVARRDLVEDLLSIMGASEGRAEQLIDAEASVERVAQPEGAAIDDADI